MAEIAATDVSRHLRQATAVALVLTWAPAMATPWSKLSSDYTAFGRLEDPIVAGQRGDLEAQRRWPDHSLSAVEARRRALEVFKTRLARLPATPPATDEAISRAVIKRQLEVQLDSIAFDEARLPLGTPRASFYSLPENVAQTTILHNEREARAWLDRLAAIPAFFASEIENMRRGIRTSFTEPAIIVEPGIRSLTRLAAEAPAASALLAPLSELPASLPAERRAALLREGAALVQEKVRPAQANLAAFLRTEYLPAARPGLGVGSLRGGNRFYAFAVRRETTTNLLPAEVHRIGQSEVARIRARMEQAKADAGFKGDLSGFLASLVSDPRFQTASADAYSEKAGEIAKRIDYLLPRYFGRLPRLTYGVMTDPDVSNKVYGGYRPGSPESGAAGAVVYPQSRRGPLYSLPAWLAHEGVPGHHFQIALSQENQTMPEYRRGVGVTAFTEGWGLYAERLAGEMGLYRDAYERFGQLSMEMWRACRLVMDTGIHAMGWTRDQAAQCLKDNTAMSSEAIYGEVDRYASTPGQALSYKIGEIRIVALRKRAEAALGARFDLRAFHDMLLGAGALPLDLLEQRVDAWIAQMGQHR